MSQGITFSGLGSGLDTDSIISQLVDIKRRPVTLLQNRQAELEQKKSLVQSINSSLISLQGTVEKLEDDDLFTIVDAKSSNTDRVGVTATNEASAGTFSIEVIDLAQARRLSSRSFSSLSDELNLSGEFVINGEGIEIEGSSSLLDIRDAINNADVGVSAQILTVSATDNRLILTADDVGEEGFGIKDASATNVLQAMGFTSSDSEVKNAFVNGGMSSQFLDADQSIGSLLNLVSPPAGTITVGDQEIAIDLASDSLNSIRDKIEAAAPSGVTATITSSDEGGLTRYRLEVEGTTNLIDDGGIMEALGVLDNGSIANQIVSGAETDHFTSSSSAIGSLLGLGSAPAATVSIGGQEIAIDLSTDSLTDIQTRINAAGIEGVSATISSTTDEEGSAQLQLRIDGTGDFVDSGNVLETLGILEGSNNSFESVAQVLTGNVGNQENGDLLHELANGARTDTFDSSTDAVGTLTGTTAAGTVTIGDQTVAIDLATDSLSGIRDKINAAAPTGVTATINAVGPSSFELQIDGTTEFTDDGGVLEALGVMSSPTAVTADTRFADIFGAGVTAGDTISFSGKNHDGDQVAGSFTISNANLKIQSLLNAVEQTFGGEVSASVDASGRLALSDDQTGHSSLTLTLTANNEGGGSLNFGTLTQTTAGSDARSSELLAGQNALFKINGITLTRSTNSITDAVQGITLNLKQAEEGEQIDVTITRDDTTTLRQNIETFVTDYNASMKMINDQFAVDEATQEGGPLSGDATLISLQAQLRSVVSGEIEGLGTEFNALVLAGISFDRNGQLTIDDELLNDALSENLDKVRSLFVAQGNTDSNNLQYVSSNSKTQAGEYAVQVTQAATQAQLIGSVEFGGALEEDETLSITDRATGQVAQIDLEAGFTLEDIVSRINTEMASDVAEVRRASIANTADGNTAILASTAFADIFGAGVQNGDTIRINGTTHSGSAVTSTFTIDDVENDTMNDLLTSIRSTFSGAVSASVDAEGRIVVTDNQVGPSQLTVTLIEENEGGGSLNFGSLNGDTKGRHGLEISARNSDNKLVLEHSGYGSRNGFELASPVEALGLAGGEVAGADVQGEINGEEADGFGRILSGKIGSETVAGLSVRIPLTPDGLDENGGEVGNVNLVYGVARRLSDTLKSITDNFDGSLKNREDAIDDTVRDIDDQIANMERRVDQYRTNLVNKFAALEGSISTMQSQGNFLTQQLSGLSK